MRALICGAFLLGVCATAQAAECTPIALTGKAAQIVAPGSSAYVAMQAVSCAQQAIRQGAPAPAIVPVVSASTPVLSGVYGIDGAAILNITATIASVAAGQGFPGGASTMVWFDATGTVHTFSSTAQFVAFGSAVAGYVYAVQMAGHGQAVPIPPTPLQIP